MQKSSNVHDASHRPSVCPSRFPHRSGCCPPSSHKAALPAVGLILLLASRPSASRPEALLLCDLPVALLVTGTQSVALISFRARRHLDGKRTEKANSFQHREQRGGPLVPDCIVDPGLTATERSVPCRKPRLVDIARGLSIHSRRFTVVFTIARHKHRQTSVTQLGAPIPLRSRVLRS